MYVEEFEFNLLVALIAENFIFAAGSVVVGDELLILDLLVAGVALNVEIFN